MNTPSQLLSSLLIFACISGQGQLTFAPITSVSTVPNGPIDIQLADLDEDGDLDMISVSTEDGLAWCKNNGDGTFGAYIQISPTTGNSDGRAFDIGDFNADDHLDLVYYNSPESSTGQCNIVWFAGDGAGNWAAEALVGAPTGSTNGTEVRAVDIDGDLDLDVLFSDLSSDQVGWVENLGAGVWGSIEIISTAVNGPEDIAAADFDGDGDMDVIVIGEYEDNISWFRQTATGWASQIVIGTGNGGQSLAIGDLDGDGDMDAAAMFFIDNKLTWYENNGDGTWGGEQVVTTALNVAFEVNMADLDMDGDLDLLSASGNDDKIAWYENIGGSFSSQNIISLAADRPIGVTAGDIDGDSDMDVASANFSANQWAWYENTTVIVNAGCTDPLACNYDPEATDDDGTCDYVDAYILDWSGPFTFCTGDGASDFFGPGIINEGNSGQNQAFVLTDENGVISYAGGTFFAEFEGSAPGVCLAYSVNYQDGLTGLFEGSNIADLEGCFDISEPITITKQLAGCTDPLACNYDLAAECSGGLCLYPGCTDALACNFDPTATCDDALCTYPGCEDATACNYDSSAGCDDGSCTYACPGYDCAGDCLDENMNGICDNEEGSSGPIAGCTDPFALNYFAVFTEDDGSCIYTSGICGVNTVWDPGLGQCIAIDDNCPGDLDTNGIINTSDLLVFLSLFDTACP